MNSLDPYIYIIDIYCIVYRHISTHLFKVKAHRYRILMIWLYQKKENLIRSLRKTS